MVKTTILQHSDIVVFQRCPLLFNKFHNHQNPISQIERNIRNCIERVFFENMRVENIPDIRPLLTYWGKNLDTTNARDGSTMLLGLKDFFDQFKKTFKDELQTVAINFTADFDVSRGTYRAIIPALMVQKKQNKIIPVMFSTKPELYIRDNEFRFALAALNAALRYTIRDLYVIKIQARVALSTSVNLFHVSDSYIQRASQDLESIVNLIGRDYNVPNTDSCKTCQFINQCKF